MLFFTPLASEERDEKKVLLQNNKHSHHLEAVKRPGTRKTQPRRKRRDRASSQKIANPSVKTMCREYDSTRD
jgi:hypothetical protein